MFTDSERVLDTDVVRADDDEPVCSNKDCSNSFEFGVRVQIAIKTTYASLFSRKSVESEEIYCPYHSPSEVKAREALQKESEYHTKREYSEIVSSDLIPTFKFYYESQKDRGKLLGPNENRTKAFFRKVSCSEAKSLAEDTIQSITTPHPILFVDTEEQIAHVYTENGRDIIDTYTESDASYGAFEEKYRDIEYSERDYYPIHTNELTGISPSNMRRYVDNIVEMSEYRRLSDTPFRLLRCPACTGFRPSIRGVHRVQIDGDEKLIPYHVYNGCQKLMGEVNSALIDESKYELTKDDKESNTADRAQTTLQHQYGQD